MSRDLMFREEIRDLVVDAYEELDEPPGKGPAAYLYDDADLVRLPQSARPWVFGVGTPVAHARLQPGEDVVDLGSGAGIDSMLAAMEVAPDGRVVGVDMLDSMVERARRFAKDAELSNVRFVASEMEDLPLSDDSVDVVISNGAINLSARKSRVFAEAFRVTRPGGRIVVSDLTIREEELPSEVLTHPSAWAG